MDWRNFWWLPLLQPKIHDDIFVIAATNTFVFQLYLQIQRTRPFWYCNKIKITRSGQWRLRPLVVLNFLIKVPQNTFKHVRNFVHNEERDAFLHCLKITKNVSLVNFSLSKFSCLFTFYKFNYLLVYRFSCLFTFENYSCLFTFYGFQQFVYFWKMQLFVYFCKIKLCWIFRSKVLAGKLRHFW